MNPFFTDRAQRLNESKSLSEYIYFSEKYCRCLCEVFLIIKLTAITYRNILTYRLTMKNLIHMSCNQFFFFSCHGINISLTDGQYNPGIRFLLSLN